MSKEPKQEWKPRGSNLDDIFGKDFEAKDKLDINDILDAPVELHGVALRNGQHGEFVLLQVKIDNTDDKFCVSCGGSIVVQKCKVLMEKKKFPYVITITKPKDKYFDIN